VALICVVFIKAEPEPEKREDLKRSVLTNEDDREEDEEEEGDNSKLSFEDMESSYSLFHA